MVFTRNLWYVFGFGGSSEKKAMLIMGKYLDL